jgi:hypothetical protein
MVVAQCFWGLGPVSVAEFFDAGWSSPVARQAHNLKVAGSNPAPATKINAPQVRPAGLFCFQIMKLAAVETILPILVLVKF